MPIALFSDLLSILTLHIYSFYMASARIFNWQYTILLSLFQLFRGKKHNVLRKRIDSCDYDLDQLLLGTILFTVLFFLLPTVVVFYIAFAGSRMAIISLKAVLESILAFLNHFPIFALMLRIKDSQRLPGLFHYHDYRPKNMLICTGGIRFELEDTRQPTDPSTGAASTPPTSYIYLRVISPFRPMLFILLTCMLINLLKSVPLTFRAMFQQYFQLGQRIRKHYLSPRVLSCLAIGKFVPPIHRKNLYSLQYSMLPARRAGIWEMWNALVAVRPQKQTAGEWKVNLNGRRLNGNGRRHMH